MDLNRRNFLAGAATGVAGSVLAGGLYAAGAAADQQANATGTATSDSYPFHGAHQAGILTPAPDAKQAYTMCCAFDVTAADRAGLESLLRTITTRSRFLATGGTAAATPIGQPPSDSDVLGPVIPADGLTVTVSAGSSLFDGRYGLAAKKPRLLAPMRVFPDDALEDTWLHGDLLLQFSAYHPDTIHHALRDVMKHTRGSLQPRWKISGYNSPPRPSGTSRNLLGFKDGTANPTGSTAESLIWVDDPAEPAWAQGGSYVVIRLIRMLVEFWDRVSINEQEKMFGRRRDSGAPLDGNAETDIPNYHTDPKGAVIPTDAHIRLANPRTAGTANQRMIRRSYNYDLGVDRNGNLQAGHVFICYQQDLKRQFETVQERLAGEPLTDYVQPFGGGYFYTLPGVRNSSDWLGRTLLA